MKREQQSYMERKKSVWPAKIITNNLEVLKKCPEDRSSLSQKLFQTYNGEMACMCSIYKQNADMVGPLHCQCLQD